MSGKRLIKKALANISAEQQRAHDAAVMAHEGRTGLNYGTGLLSEGYVGGYQDGLRDALLAMDGVVPYRRGWWPKS